MAARPRLPLGGSGWRRLRRSGAGEGLEDRGAGAAFPSAAAAGSGGSRRWCESHSAPRDVRRGPHSGQYFEYGNYLSPFYSPLFTPRGVRGGSAGALYPWAGAFPRDFLLSQVILRSLRRPGGLRGGSAKSEGYCETKFPSSCRTSTVTSCTWRSVMIRSKMTWRKAVFEGRSASAPSFAILASTYHHVHPLSCHRCAIWWAASSNCFWCVAGGAARGFLSLFNGTTWPGRG